MVEENKIADSESLIHGGGPKVLRVHFALLKLRGSREVKNWMQVYYSLENLYMEVEAYMTDQERIKVLPTWKKITEYMGEYERGSVNNGLMGETFLFEVEVRRILARLHLDMEPKAKQMYLQSALGGDFM